MTTSVEDETASTTANRRAALDSRLAAARIRRPWRQRLRLPLMVAGPALVLLAAGQGAVVTGSDVPAGYLPPPPVTGDPRIDWLGGLITGYGNRPYTGHTASVRVIYRF